MKDNNGIYTERLKTCRKDKEITLRVMAEMLGYNSPSSYMYIERGEVQPTIETMNKISKTLGKSVEYFFKLNIQEYQTDEVSNDETMEDETNIAE